MSGAPIAESLPSRRPVWAGALLCAATAVAYLPAANGVFVWDDQYYVTDNLLMGSLDGLLRIWLVVGSADQYYPMVHTSFWLEYGLWGIDPRGYHVTNVLLHAANAVLLWRVLARLSLPGAWVAAALFGLHPIEVETVAWIAERKNLLSTLFYLLAMLSYFRFEPPERERDPDADGRWHGVAFVLFLAALFSKTVTASLPAAILLVFWWKRGRVSWRALRPLTVFFAAGISLGALTVWMEKYVVGAQGAGWDLSPIDRLLIAGRAVWFYAGKLAWPVSLSFNYPRWEIDSHQPGQYAYPLTAVLLLAVAFALRGRIGRGPLAAVLFFGGTLVPALGFFDVFPFRFSFDADHFQYLAGIGLIALFAAVSTLALRRLPRTWPGDAMWLALAAVLAVLTWQQASIYQSRIGLWQDVIRKNPESVIAHNNIAHLYAEQGNHERALRHNREALRIDPGYELNHLNLAANLVRLGRTREAIEHLEIQIERFDDDFRAHERLAEIYEQYGKPRLALEHYEAARRHGPENPRNDARIRSLRRRLGLEARDRDGG